MFHELLLVASKALLAMAWSKPFRTPKVNKYPALVSSKFTPTKHVGVVLNVLTKTTRHATGRISR